MRRWGRGETGAFATLPVGIRIVQPLWRTSGRSSKGWTWIYPTSISPQGISEGTEKTAPQKLIPEGSQQWYLSQPQMETSHMSVGWRKERESVADPYSEDDSARKEMRFWHRWPLDVPWWSHCTKWRETVTKDHVVYVSVYMQCPEGTNLQRWKIDL